VAATICLPTIGDSAGTSTSTSWLSIPCVRASSNGWILSRTGVSTLSSLYLKEKTFEEEFPGIGFRDAAGGREAYILGHRVAVWEVVDVYGEAKTIAKTAGHFRWPPALVRSALAFAKAFSTDIEQQREAEASV